MKLATGSATKTEIVTEKEGNFCDKPIHVTFWVLKLLCGRTIEHLELQAKKCIVCCNQNLTPLVKAWKTVILQGTQIDRNMACRVSEASRE